MTPTAAFGDQPGRDGCIGMCVVDIGSGPPGRRRPVRPISRYVLEQSSCPGQRVPCAGIPPGFAIRNLQGEFDVLGCEEEADDSARLCFAQLTTSSWGGGAGARPPPGAPPRGAPADSGASIVVDVVEVGVVCGEKAANPAIA